jgi:hypothetical protein
MSVSQRDASQLKRRQHPRRHFALRVVAPHECMRVLREALLPDRQPHLRRESLRSPRSPTLQELVTSLKTTHSHSEQFKSSNPGHCPPIISSTCPDIQTDKETD